MENLSGLVLDVYDDKSSLVQIDPATLPGGWNTPEMVKTCSTLSAEQLDQLPDSCFALVLQDGDAVLRKFACVDAGNTTLHVGYFLQTGHKLPIEAQKVAADNLVKACGWYGLEPPGALQKIALGLGSLAMGALVVPGAARDAGKNLQAVKGTGGAIVTPVERQQRRAAMGV